MLEIKEYSSVVSFRAARSILGHAFYHTAAYWVDGLLVDTTCAYTAHELLNALSARTLVVKQVVNTHCHEDHIGANGLLQRVYGVPILAHPLALPILANPKLQYLQPYRRFFWGWPQPSQGQSLEEWVETQHCRFQVLHTPGHSPDHICLYEPELGWLFTGDAYIGGQDRAARPDYDIYEVIASLKKLAALDVTVLFPGSGSVRMNHPTAEIQRKIAYLEELGARVRDLRRQGYSVYAIQKRLLGKEPYITYLTQGHFRGVYLIQAYLRGPFAAESENS